jgi:hypothetical protein
LASLKEAFDQAAWRRISRRSVPKLDIQLRARQL